MVNAGWRQRRFDEIPCGYDFLLSGQYVVYRGAAPRGNASSAQQVVEWERVTCAFQMPAAVKNSRRIKEMAKLRFAPPLSS